MDSFERLKTLVAQADDDVKKAAGGNKAAGTRVRQTMQEIKAAAQEVREKILEMRDAGGGASAPGAGGAGGSGGGSQD